MTQAGSDASPALDVLGFIANLVDSLAWPVVVVALGFIFKAEARAVLRGLTSLSVGNTRATFEPGLQRAEATAASIESDSEAIRESGVRNIEALLTTATLHPRAAILEAWILIEKAARSVAENSGLPLDENLARPYFSLQKFLAKNELLPKAEIDAFRELRLIRNKAAHSSDFDVSTDQAERYIRIANRLIESINTIR
ncbi:MAG: hypothetical protein VX529_04720 [Pseudomonadota bacterium]|nr:hypothetical protein [Pseudomonadota bacterium]